MSNEWLILLIGAFFGGIGGAIAGYHKGLARATEAIWEACPTETSPWAGRERVIKECILAIIAIRPELAKDIMQMEDYNFALWHRHGIDDAIDALQCIDKRGAGHYGIPRNVMELRSRAALDKEEQE